MTRLFDRQRGHLFPWCPVFYGAGIALYFALPVEPGRVAWVGLAVALVLGVSLLLFSGPARRSPPVVAVVLIFAGLAVAGSRTASVAAPKLTFRYYGPVEGRIVAIDRSQSDAVRLTLDRVRLSRVEPSRTPRRVRLSLHGTQGFVDPAPGLVVAATAHLAPPSGPVEPGGYDFRRQAWFRGIGAVGYTRTPVLAIAAPEPGWGLWLFHLRHRMSAAVRDALPDRTGAFAAAITTGDRSALDRETLTDLRRTNLAHLLAISGLHMGMLTGVVFVAVRASLALLPHVALRWPVKKIGAVAALLAGAYYLALSGGNVATERAFIMVSVLYLAVLVDRRAITLRAVALAALIVLTLRPEALLGPGFQMSFAATTALVAVYGGMRRLEFARRGPAWGRWIGGVALSSLIAGLATAPIGAAHFNQVPHFGLLANVASVPVMGLLIMPAAVLSAVLAPVGGEDVGLFLMGLGIGWILRVAETVAAWPGAVSQVVAPNAAALPLLAGSALWLALWQGRGKIAAIVPALAAAVIWFQTERPPVLIADSGRLLGVMTPEGRALSKPRGDGFAATSWLENDGDAVSQEAAAARWPGEGSAVRVGEASVWLVGGRGAAEVVREGCTRHDVTVTSAKVAVDECTILDARALRRTGAVALWETPDGLRIVTARDRAGRRPWSR